MILSTLCEKAGLTYPAGAGQILVSGICTDSTKLCKGELFVCLKGTQTDSHAYLADVAEQGACAAVIAQDFAGEIPKGLFTLRVSDTRVAVAYLLDAWYGNPSRKMKFVGVTGTNGKTSVSWLLYELLRYAQIPCALIGTVKCEGPLGEFPKDVSGCANMTTPAPEQLYPMLAKMAEQGTQIVVMEVTSHALAMERCAPIHFDLGIFTNFTRDHLDFHGSMESYFAAKKKLLLQCEKALINIDDAQLATLRTSSPCPLYTCSARTAQADFYPEEVSMSFSGVRYKLVSANARVRLTCSLLGQFAVINSIQASAAMLLLGIKAQKIRDGMALVPPIPGRMERVELRADVKFSVYIDYAHTPDALESLLRAVQRVKLRSQRIVLVFGCGGDRDKGKRAQMGQIASRMADYFVITADNSRTEPVANIIADIVRGVDRRAHYRVIQDRYSAIRHVIAHARANDVILLVGKGHEDYEIVQNTRKAFDEKAIVRQAVAEYWKSACEDIKEGE
ncbi:MAG: UDP-N-acetylmuramoyl-L-alanyl-D-glutamate--2,6-diaminopimelate ligase [Clostridia bacterium]|nr:UDP-N-acetylmuramoyl-L-alanyl-D-glutamate--2,6-diaminopimelate ligase [Clostridia bacterium]